MAQYQTPILGSFNSSASTDELESCQIIDTYGIGIDCHSRFIQLCILINRSDSIKKVEGTFTTDPGDLFKCRGFIREVLKENGLEDYDFHYCIESTGTYHYPVIRELKGRPRVVNPAIAGQSKRKTDVLDARILAQQDIAGLWKDSFIPDDDLNILRVYIKEREQLKKLRIQEGNRIRDILLRFGHTVNAYGAVGNTYTDTVIADLIAGHIPDTLGVNRDGLPDEIITVLSKNYNKYKLYTDSIAEQNKTIRKKIISMKFPFGNTMIDGRAALQRLTSVPGVGEQAAFSWLSEIYDIKRFEVVKQCAAYCGFDPSLKVSAGKVTSHKKRGGNAKLHSVLVNCASSAISRHKTPLGKWGYHIYRKNVKGGWKKACNAVGRRIVVALYHIQRLNEDYDISKYTFWQRNPVKEMHITEMNLGRFTSLLMRMGFENSIELTKAYYGDLAAMKGVGAKCLEAVQNWIKENSLQESSSEVKSSVEKRRNLKKRRESIITSSAETRY